MSLRLTLSGGTLCWRLPLSRTDLEQALEAMIDVLTAHKNACPSVELDLLLVRDADMAERNQLYMGCHGPTNILSFPLDGVPAGQQNIAIPSTVEKKITTPLGSLVLSVDTFRREILLYGQDPQEHCLRLLAHGLGHLAGYDHSPEMEELCASMLDAGLWTTTDCATNEV